MANMAKRLDDAGADGLVLFNRFYQPDIDVENLEVEPTLRLSDSSELNLRLRWLAVVSGHVRASLAVSGGVHNHIDAVKAVMTGAHAVQVVSGILQQGPDIIRRIREGLTQWLEEHEYDSLEQMRGSMNLLRCPDASMFERANYIRILQGYKV
jgi:dihydroorotate dehydrogenase (fumarate)